MMILYGLLIGGICTYVHNYDQKLCKKLFGRFRILMLYTFKNSAYMYNIKNYMRRSMLPLKSLPIYCHIVTDCYCMYVHNNVTGEEFPKPVAILVGNNGKPMN